jgi:cell division protein FtsX
MSPAELVAIATLVTAATGMVTALTALAAVLLHVRNGINGDGINRPTLKKTQVVAKHE